MLMLIPIITFIIIITFIWGYAYRRTRAVSNTSTEGYFLGGRSLTGFTIAGSVIMTNLSTEQIVGQNGQSYTAGMEVMAWEVIAAIAIVLLALVFLPKYLKYGVDTISDFIEIRFDTATKRIVSFLFIFTYMISFLPAVLYSGSLVFNKIFSIDRYLGIDPLIATALISGVIGIIGLLYLLMGGLSLSASSDAVYGVGLLIVGLSIPVAGLFFLGDGNFIDGLNTVRINTPDKLNAIGAIDSEVVPWPTLLLGMLFNNLFFWCTNQMIVQKALAGKNLKEAQKGAIYVGFFKVLGALFLVFPGILAFNIFGDSLSTPDDAFPHLAAEILPKGLYGVLGAVIFGAILSSFVGALNATATLFTLDFYKPFVKKGTPDSKIARAGKFITILVGIISVVIAPLVSFAPSGLYNVIQEFNGVYSMPLLATILFGFYSKRVTPLAAKVTFVFHILAYAFTSFALPELHYLYAWSILFLMDAFIMWFIGKIKPLNTPFAFRDKQNKVDLTPWKHVKWLSAVIIICVISIYILFSPWGLA